MQTQTHFRVNNDEQNQFELILKANGLTPNEAYKIFRRKTIETGALPFELNATPTPRLKEALKSKDYVEFDNAKDGLDWLND